MSDHEGFKSSRLDSYSKLGVVALWFQTAPLEAFVIARKWYRKLAALGVSQWPLNNNVITDEDASTRTLGRVHTDTQTADRPRSHLVMSHVWPFRTVP